MICLAARKRKRADRFIRPREQFQRVRNVRRLSKQKPSTSPYRLFLERKTLHYRDEIQLTSMAFIPKNKGMNHNASCGLCVSSDRFRFMEFLYSR